MKIWEARLNLICIDVDKYDLNFNFEPLEDYRENMKYNEWIHSEGWVCDRVPMEMTVSTSYGNISVTQGFDHNLNEEEQKDIEISMRKFIRKRIEDDMEVYKRQYKEKIKVINI